MGNTNREIKATGHFKTVEKYPHQSNRVVVSLVTDVDQKKKTQQIKKKKTEQIKKLQKKKE